MKHVSILFLALTTTATALAALPADVAPAGRSQNQQSASNRHFGINGIYKFTKNTEVVPEAAYLNGELVDNIGDVSLDVHKDEAVALEFLNDGKILLTLRLPEEELGGDIPEQMIISMEEYQALGLKLESTGGVNDLMAKYTGYFDTEVAARNRSRARPRRHTVRQEDSRRGGGFRRDRNGRIAGGGGNCVRVVKSMTGFSGVAGNGVGMASALQRVGWRDVGTGARFRGVVCSWSGGIGGKGHVGYFDGSCFVPTYGGNCGSPGRGYSLRKCVARG